MMHKILVVGLGMLVAAGLVMPVQAAGDRIAVVQLEQLLKAHPDTVPAETSLEKQRTEFETERRSMLDEMGRRKEAFESLRDEAANEALSEDVRKEKLKALEEAYGELRKYEKEIQEIQIQRQKELNDHGRRLRGSIVEKIRAIIETYAEDKGFTVVLNVENAGMNAFGTVLYSADKSDITADVRSLIEKQAAP